MKKLFGFVLVLSSLVGSLSAQAIFDPSWERPLQRAELTQLHDSQPFPAFPMPQTLTLNRRDGSRKAATSFTLQEDTGIRCIMAPCPSSKNTMFKVTAITVDEDGAVIYEAREVVKPLPNVRIAARVLKVTDFSNVEGADVDYLWNVELQTFVAGTRQFGGNPEGVITIQ